MSPRRFVFNPPTASIFTSSTTTVYLESNDPTVILEELAERQTAHTRHGAQQDAIPATGLAGPPSLLFEEDVRRFCREYVVRRIWVDDEREAESDASPPLGNAPPRALSGRPLATEALMQALASPRGSVRPGDQVLYLFNVIVALEWVPTPQRLRRLQWAFRRASDYLYDVTNGGMAFGQVILAGPSWMPGADIQILASNRLLPRSWVSGLLESHKYTPIRLGRGLWVRDRRIVLDWDEPEGYRALVHEWAHYALGLKDEYMGVRYLTIGAEEHAVVLPNRRVKSESIMASVQGNSELTGTFTSERASEGNLGRVLRERYPHLSASLSQNWSGPGLMPLPLPHFRLAGELAEQALATERTLYIPVNYAKNALESATEPTVPLDEDAIPTGRWEVFVTRLAGGKPTRLVFQGEIDARAPELGFTLLGAEQGDTILLMSSAGPLQVWARTLDDQGDASESLLAQRQWRRLLANQGAPPPQSQDSGGDSTTEESHQAEEEGQPWEPALTPAAITLMGIASGAPEESVTPTSSDVLPITPPQPEGLLPQKARAQVELGADSSDTRFENFVFGIGDPANRPIEASAQAYSLPSLDGYVVTTLKSADDSAVPPLVISDFSQGGPPGTAPSMISDPISAGAASGEALILCDVRESLEQAEGYRVVTTTMRGVPLPAGSQAFSPVFSVATNIPLLKSFTPTLLIVNTFDDGSSLDDVRICRVKDGGLEQLPTHIAADGAYAVAPLLPANSDLVIEAAAPPAPGKALSERFVLARMPLSVAGS